MSVYFMVKYFFFSLHSHNFFLCKITDVSPLIKRVCTLQTFDVSCFLWRWQLSSALCGHPVVCEVPTQGFWEGLLCPGLDHLKGFGGSSELGSCPSAGGCWTNLLKPASQLVADFSARAAAGPHLTCEQAGHFVCREMLLKPSQSWLQYL